MLVLSRKVGEEIVIGENIRVRVLSIHGNQIRLGLIAPRTVTIQREELITRRENDSRTQLNSNMPLPDAVVEQGLATVSTS